MKVQGVFVVESAEIGRNRGENAVILRGTVGLEGELQDADGIETTDIAVVVHTKDGQSPVKLGAKLKVTITDEL